MCVHVFNPNTKTFYRPIDAALRWCDLTRYEAQIIQADWSRPENLATLFPQWPNLHIAVERILDAIRNGELPYGSLGISVPLGSYVEPYQLTIRHSDLRVRITASDMDYSGDGYRVQLHSYCPLKGYKRCLAPSDSMYSTRKSCRPTIAANIGLPSLREAASFCHSLISRPDGVG